MNRSQKWNKFQICPHQDSITGGSDLWSSTLPLDHRGPPNFTRNNHHTDLHEEQQISFGSVLIEETTQSKSSECCISYSRFLVCDPWQDLHNRKGKTITKNINDKEEISINQYSNRAVITTQLVWLDFFPIINIIMCTSMTMVKVCWKNLTC